MSTFTTTLKTAVELTHNHIGLDDYPIFDGAYREGLNAKIFDHFMNREIGQETIDMFRLALRRKMNEIMPLYNQLYKSQLLVVDPFLTFRSSSHTATDGASSGHTTSDSHGTNTSDSDSKSRAVSSETPQTRLEGDQDYATAAQDSVSHSGATGGATEAGITSQTGTQGGTADATASGFSVSQSALLLEYRQTFITVDMLVIAELETLFMLVWDTGEAFTQGSALYPFYSIGGF